MPLNMSIRTSDRIPTSDTPPPPPPSRLLFPVIFPRVSGTQPILIVGASVSNPDPGINVGFREGTVIAAGEGMDDAVRLVYSGGQPMVTKGEGATGGSVLDIKY